VAEIQNRKLNFLLECLGSLGRGYFEKKINTLKEFYASLFYLISYEVCLSGIFSVFLLKFNDFIILSWKS
jgi:predicted nuclease of restriction endonuclease-like RecB superfamily